MPAPVVPIAVPDPTLRATRIRRIARFLYALTALSHALFAAAVAHACALAGIPYGRWIGVGVAIPLAFAIDGRLRRMVSDGPLPTWRLTLVEEPYYAHWTAGILALPLFAITAPIALLSGSTLGAAALASYAIMLTFTAYGVLVRRRWVRVREIEIALAGLDQAFDGYRIAHLSDLHIGGHWPRDRARAWVRRVKDLDVDLVALTGDYVTRGDAFHADIAEVLGELSARDGSIAIMGNHDYFGDGEALIARLRGKGLTVLRNERTRVTRGDAELVFAGVDDTWTHLDDVDRAMEGAETSKPIVVLAHDPRLFPALARAGAALVLSGHTHWGQIAVPFFATRLNPSRFSYRHHAGLYREGDATLYVSPGLGTTGPPLRLGAPPEITVLRLRAAGREHAEGA